MTNLFNDETTTTGESSASAMGNGHKKTAVNSFSADDLAKHAARNSNNHDVANWSSREVQNWVKQQCKKYDLKKTTLDKFEMNGRIK